MNNVLSLLSLSLVSPFTNEVLDLGIILWFQEICTIKLWFGIIWLGHYMLSLKTGILTSGIFGEASVVVQIYACYFFLLLLGFFCHGNESGFRSWKYSFIVSGLWLSCYLRHLFSLLLSVSVRYWSFFKSLVGC